MNVALVYRGFYKRYYDSDKKNTFNIEILNNHIDSINSLGVKNIDIYFHTYSNGLEEDKNMLSLFKEVNLENYYIDYKPHNKITTSIIKSLKLVENGNVKINLRILDKNIADFDKFKNMITYLNIKKKGKYKNFLKGINQNKKNYDLIINTRFDIMFLKKLNEFNLDKDKFNLCFKDNKLFWENIKLRKVSDLLYIYHPKYNNVLIEALKKSENMDRNWSGYFIYNYLNLDKDEINFMIEGFYSSNTDVCINEYLYIKRK